MAKLDDVTQGFIDAWNEFVDHAADPATGKDPKSYLNDRITANGDPLVRARQMGRRNAARDYVTLRSA